MLNITFLSDLSRQLQEVKESIRRTELLGLAYSMASHIDDSFAGFKGDICFNFLGQFDSDMADKSFSIARESCGPQAALDSERPYLLDVSGMIADGQLEMSITFSNEQFRSQTISDLVGNYERHLIALIQFCAGIETRSVTPSDVSDVEMSIEDLDDLFS
jgi:non-ribosomal peptide synthase protein (TIGR01720 family)